jgi:hypothetical protein
MSDMSSTRNWEKPLDFAFVELSHRDMTRKCCIDIDEALSMILRIEPEVVAIIVVNFGVVYNETRK